MKFIYNLLFKNDNKQNEDRFIVKPDDLMDYVDKMLNNRVLSLINGFRNKSRQDRIKLYSNYQNKLIEDINNLEIPKLIVAPLESKFIKHKRGESVTIGFETNIEIDNLDSVLFFFQVSEDNIINFYVCCKHDIHSSRKIASFK